MTILPRQAVVVLGMHRSGTSAVAGALVRLGLAAPRTELPGSDDNPAGFYESVPVVMADYHLMMTAGCHWDACIGFEPDWLGGTVAARLTGPLTRILDAEFPSRTSFVLKDPRMCLTLPAWLPALRGVADRVHAVLVLRSPVAVAASLAARNGTAEVVSAALWLHHVLEAERVSRALPRAVCVYDAIQRDWRAALQRLRRGAGVAFPRDMGAAAADLDGFIAPPRNGGGKAGGLSLPGAETLERMVAEAWGSFLALAEMPNDAGVLATLVRLRTRFAEWRGARFPLARPADEAWFR